jgi:hypothetical protein
MTVLERRLGRPLPPVVSAVVAVTGKQPLRRVSWRKRLRRPLGPINVPYEEATVTLHFEFDQISSPGKRVDYEIEATAHGSSTHESERALRQLFSHTDQLATTDGLAVADAGNDALGRGLAVTTSVSDGQKRRL